jgi:hypothetical protein
MADPIPIYLSKSIAFWGNKFKNEMNRFYYFCLLSTIGGILLAFIMPTNQVQNQVALTQTGKIYASSSYEAGSTIRLEYVSPENSTVDVSQASPPIYLYLSYSYGSTLLSPSLQTGTFFVVPKEISNKSGQVLWKLLYSGRVVDQGSFLIHTAPLVNATVESYLGPPTVVAGGGDYSVITVLATDSLDNLLNDGVPLFFNEQYKNKRTTTQIEIHDRIAWNKIISPEKAGRISLSASAGKGNTKEMTLDVLPNNAVDFEIFEERIHPYADGNQIAIYKTSQITDAYGNIVSDGTVVRFEISSNEGSKWYTSATTINGFAFGRTLHPNTQSLWRIKAFVDGVAESEELFSEYKSIIDDFEVNFSEDNRNITIGPLKSPDGTKVALRMGSESRPLYKTTRNGKVVFQLSEKFNNDGFQPITIEVLDISKKFKIELK